MKNIFIALALTLCFSVGLNASKRKLSEGSAGEEFNRKRAVYLDESVAHHAEIPKLTHLYSKLIPLGDDLGCEPKDMLIVFKLYDVVFHSDSLQLVEKKAAKYVINALIHEGYRVILQTSVGDGKDYEVPYRFHGEKQYSLSDGLMPLTVKVAHRYFQGLQEQYSDFPPRATFEYAPEVDNFSHFLQGVYCCGPLMSPTLWDLLNDEQMKGLFEGHLPKAIIVVDDQPEVLQKHKEHPDLLKLTYRILFNPDTNHQQ